MLTALISGNSRTRIIGTYTLMILLLLNSVLVFNATVDDGRKLKASATLVAVDIVMDNAVVFSEVGPGKSGISVNKGWVVVKKWPMANAQFISVYLEVSSEDWTSVVMPSIMTISQSEFNRISGVKKRISVAVNAPQTAKFHETREVTITGRWVGYPNADTPVAGGSVNPAYYKVEVKQYYYVFLDSKVPFKTVWLQQPTTFSLTIENRGNGVDTFYIEVVNAHALAERGWAVEIRDSSVTIGPNNKTDIEVVVYPPGSFSLWSNNIQEIPIRVTSKYSIEAANKGENVSVDWQQYSLFYHEFGPYVDPVPTSAFIIGILILALCIRYVRRRRRGLKGLGLSRRVREMERAERERQLREELGLSEDELEGALEEVDEI